MSMRLRRPVLIAAGAGLIGSASAPALAQPSRDAVLDILIECSKVSDVTARVACYDNNIRPLATPPAPRASAAPTAPVAPSTPPPSASPPRPSPPVVAAREAEVPQRSEALRQRPPAPPASSGRVTVSEVAERRPGAYLLTLQDGAQWEFVEDMPESYRPPRKGSQVEIERGSLGGHRMRFDGQRAVRVQRVR